MRKIPFKLPMLVGLAFVGSLLFVSPASAKDRWGFSVNPYGLGFHYSDNDHHRHSRHHRHHHYNPYRYYHSPRYHGGYYYPQYQYYSPGWYGPGISFNFD